MLAKVKRYLVWMVAAIAAVFAILLGLRRREDTRIREDLARRQGETSDVGDVVARAKAEVAESRDLLAEEKAKAAKRKETAEDLARRLRDLAHIFLLMLLFWALLVPVGTPVLAAEAERPVLPSDYDTLAKYYVQVLDIAQQYKQLYEESEASNARLMAEVEKLQTRIQELTALVEKLRKLIDDQQATIMRLLSRKPLGVVAGLTVTGLAPPTPGLMVGVMVGF